eukprot:7055244-Prymnesium_polylepis.1
MLVGRSALGLKLVTEGTLELLLALRRAHEHRRTLHGGHRVILAALEFLEDFATKQAAVGATGGVRSLLTNFLRLCILALSVPPEHGPVRIWRKKIQRRP